MHHLFIYLYLYLSIYLLYYLSILQDCVAALLSFSQTQDIPDKDGRTALMWAAERGNYNIVKTMIERRIDVNVQDNHGATG